VWIGDARRRAVFLDRDGTINEEVNYLSRPEQLRLLPNAAEGIKLLRAKGFLAIIVTNQSGVARGYFSEQRVLEIHQDLQALLAKAGAAIDGFYYCPHHPQVGYAPYRRECECRKPKPGMLLRAAKDFQLDLAQCFVAGDKVIDILPGIEVGCRTVLVLTGYGQETLNDGLLADSQPNYVAVDLLDAAKWIIKASG
jgi:D-glycero-D-manno-heptose 1,7-bisphosphate phosphatase